jgi:hypothetical protein
LAGYAYYAVVEPGARLVFAATTFRPIP